MTAPRPRPRSVGPLTGRPSHSLPVSRPELAVRCTVWSNRLGRGAAAWSGSLGRIPPELVFYTVARDHRWAATIKWVPSPQLPSYEPKPFVCDRRGHLEKRPTRAGRSGRHCSQALFSADCEELRAGPATLCRLRISPAGRISPASPGSQVLPFLRFLSFFPFLQFHRFGSCHQLARLRGRQSSTQPRVRAEIWRQTAVDWNNRQAATTRLRKAPCLSSLACS